MLPVKCILPTRIDQADGESQDAASTQLVVSNNNRWSRATLNFDGIEPDLWCEFNFQLDTHPEEDNRAAPDFAVVGLDFQTGDGSSIDFAYVPGLTRTQIDPHSWYVTGPDYRAHEAKPHEISFGFFMPSPARRLSVTFRSWRNSHPFTISEPKLLQGGIQKSTHATGSDGLAPADSIITPEPLNARRSWRPIHVEATWFKFSLLPGRNLLVRGQIINEGSESTSALARIVYRDARREELPFPYPEIAAAPSVGAFVDIPVHRQARRFTLNLVPPPGAASVEIGFQAWHAPARMKLVTPLEVSVDEDLSLEAVSGDGVSDAPTFLNRVMERIDGTSSSSESMSNDAMLMRLVDHGALGSAFTFHDKLAAVQRGKAGTIPKGELVLAGLPAWSLPEEPRWIEDPYQSLAWRLEFQSLAWLSPLVAEEDPENLKRAIKLATSWSHANPWGKPSDPISLHPRALSARAETLLLLLSSSVKAPQPISSQDILIIFAEVVRHGFAIAQILGQNVFSHSVVQVHAACALLALAQALPQIPFAANWTSLAHMHLSDGFERLIDENGSFVDQSLHIQLELISLGLILTRCLEGVSETRELCSNLAVRIRKGLRTLVAVTAPSGMLPAFGDTPYGFHHASWLRRLISGYGTELLSDRDLTTELSYPTGRKIFPSPLAGLIAARHYEQNSQWGYFCTSLNSRHHEHGHNDCTSFVYSAGGAPWIVDPQGSNLHETGAARQYIIASRSHNVALPNQREQIAGSGWIVAHQDLEGASIFKICTNVYGPSYEHHRIFIILDKLDGIAVLDRFVTRSKAVSFEGFLHFDTDIVMAIANTQLGVAYRKSEKMRIQPCTVEGNFSGMSVECGRNDLPGAIQGFIAGPSGRLQPANVLRYRFSGQKSVCGGVLLSANEHAIHSLTALLETEAVRDLLDHNSDESVPTDRSNSGYKPWAPDQIERP